MGGGAALRTACVEASRSTKQATYPAEASDKTSLLHDGHCARREFEVTDDRQAVAAEGGALPASLTSNPIALCSAKQAMKESASKPDTGNSAALFAERREYGREKGWTETFGRQRRPRNK
jgi:hypothetical protein